MRLPRREPDPVRDAARGVRVAKRELRRRERRESRRFSAHARRRRRAWLIVGSSVGALVLFVMVGVFTPVMGVRQFEIVGAEAVSTEDLEESLASFEGTPLALVSDRDVEIALRDFPLIQRYAVERVPPDTLRVRIVERVPVLSIKEDGEFRRYDAAGVLVGSSKKSVKGVPLARGGAAELGTPAFEASARIVRDMPVELRKKVARVKASGDQDVTLTLRGGLRVIWGSPEDTQRKAVVLDAMLKALQGRDVGLIDVSSSEAPIFR